MTPALVSISTALFLWGMGESLFLYFQPIYLAQLGASPLLIGTIMGGAGIFMTVAHIPAGYLAAKIGRRPMLRAAWIFGLLATLRMATVHSLTAFAAGMLMYSFTVFVIAPMNSYITVAAKKWSVARALTLISATYNTGATIGPFIGGYLGNVIGLRMVYFVSAGLFAISAFFIFRLPPQPIEKHSAPGETHFDLLQNSRYWGFLALSLFVMFSMYLPQPLTPNFLHEIRNLSLTEIGKLGSAAGFGNAMFNLALGALEPRIGFALGQACVWFFSFIIWKAESVPFLALGYFLLGGYRASRPLATAQVRSLVHSAQMGLAYGITETVNASPIIFAPILAGYLYEQNPFTIYPISLGLILAGIALTLFFAPRRTARQIPETAEV